MTIDEIDAVLIALLNKLAERRNDEQRYGQE